MRVFTLGEFPTLSIFKNPACHHVGALNTRVPQISQASAWSSATGPLVDGRPAGALYGEPGQKGLCGAA